jgi:hypothetical protein
MMLDADKDVEAVGNGLGVGTQQPHSGKSGCPPCG